MGKWPNSRARAGTPRATMWDGRPRPSDCRKRLGNWRNSRRLRLPMRQVRLHNEGVASGAPPAHGRTAIKLPPSNVRDSLYLAAAEPIKTQHWAHAWLRQNKACIDQHGAEGPAPSRLERNQNCDGMDVSTDLSSEALGEGGSLGESGGHPSLKNDIDLEGCSLLQPRNPIKATLGVCLGCAKQSLYRSAQRRGTGRAPGLGEIKIETTRRPSLPEKRH